MVMLKIGDHVEIGIDSNGQTCGPARKTSIVSWMALGAVVDIGADTKDGRAVVFAGGGRWCPDGLRKVKKPPRIKTRKR